jgi:undecaprenyl-diphosphatase
MFFLQVILLAIVQGLAELLPVSSSAHVIVAEKLMGLDPSSPAMTLLLVMLHTGTMFAVIVYFWKQWKRTFFSGTEEFKRFAGRAIIATVITALIGEGLVKILQHTIFNGVPNAQVEDLFSRLDLVAPALFAAGHSSLSLGSYEDAVPSPVRDLSPRSLRPKPPSSVGYRGSAYRSVDFHVLDQRSPPRC